MQVTFGLRLDERQGPSDKAYFMSPIVGRLGFLGLLETYLGLARPEVSAAQRVAAYLGHLRRCDNAKRFYSRSLEVDDIGVAAQLLGWRDEWRLGGWDGKAAPTSPPRILDLAAVEESASGDIAPGEGERLAEVIAALGGRKVPITSVELVDPLECFPWAWQEVLARLPNVEPQIAQATGAGKLGALQALARDTLSGGELKNDPLVIDDGQVHVLQAQSAETAEHWLSAWCRANPANRLVLCERGGDSLDATLVATGSPACGFDSASDLRPALQTLGLALEMCWAPLDVDRLFEFLAHPFGPFSRSARGKLARAFAKQPGLGGQAWDAAKAAIAEQEDGQAILEEIAFWLEGERWSRADGAPLDDLSVRTEKIHKALQRRATLGDGVAAAISSALHQCSAVRDGLAEFKRQGVTHLVPRQVEQLIAQSTPGGATNPAAASQVGCLKSASTAAACIEPASEVIWWMPSTPTLPRPLPWSEGEVAALKSLGVVLRNPKQELELLAAQWLRPLFAAKEHFLLVLPPPGAEEHPIWQLLKKLAPSLQVERIDDALYGVHRDVIAHRVPDVPFQQAERYINLDRPVASRKQKQSFTSLDLLFNNPAVAALQDAAALEAGATLFQGRENQLLGTLAHRVVELLFQQDGSLNWTNKQALAWFDCMLDALLTAEGVPLLMQGAGVTAHRFKRICAIAICELLDHLRSAQAVRVRTEVSIDGQLGNVPLTGNIDLLIELPGNRTVALDMKWTGSKRYAETLVEGRHLQLALYASLIQQVDGLTPIALGYFIIDKADLYVTAPDIFPKAQVRSPRNGITVHDLLAQARKTWEYRMEQWRAGIVELVPPLDDLTDFQLGEGMLPVGSLGPWHQEHFTLLGGWDQ